MSFLTRNEVQLATNPQLDAFGRLRKSDPFTLFDSSFLVDKKPYLWGEDSTGTASATYLPNESSIELSVGTASGDRMLRRTFEWFRYQPAKSLLVFNTFVLGAKKNNVTKRVGYFSNDDGIFLEQTGSDLAIVLRTSTSGTASDARRITQNSWNVDTFDGTGPSGITLDDTQAQILFMDMEWLGVGSVRIGFVIDGAFYLAHEFQNANQTTSVYMKRASLPVSYEIVNTATTSGTTTFKQICSSVISEGGFNERFNNVNVQSINRVVNAEQPVLSIRLKSAYARGKIIVDNVDLLSRSADNFFWKLIAKPTLTASSFTSISDASEADNSVNNYSGGIIMAGGFTIFRRTSSSNFVNSQIPITSDLDGTPHIITLVAGTPIANSGRVFGSMTIREIY